MPAGRRKPRSRRSNPTHMMGHPYLDFAWKLVVLACILAVASGHGPESLNGPLWMLLGVRVEATERTTTR